MSGAPFVVLTLTRSGSTWLLSLLNGQSGVSAYEELFDWRHMSDRYAWVAEGSPTRFITRRPDLGYPRAVQLWRYLNEVEAFAGERQAFGFKLMLGQLRNVPELLPILMMRRWRLIALLRDNLFEGAVSRRVLDVTGDAHSRSAGAAERSLQLDPAPLVREMRRRRTGLRTLRALARTWPAPSVTLRYGDLVTDQHDALSRVLRTLGVDQSPTLVASPLKRRIDRPYNELIENFDEVRAAVIAAGMRDALPTALRDAASTANSSGG